jgi:hypothetical protein
MVKPKVYADFHNADANGRLRLNCVGTVEDLARQGITLRDGMPLTLYSDDVDPNGQLDELVVDGVVSFSDEEHCWVAAIDWSAIHHASERQMAPADGGKRPSETPAGEDSRAQGRT